MQLSSQMAAILRVVLEKTIRSFLTYNDQTLTEEVGKKTSSCSGLTLSNVH